ncbi:MAG: exodeoxyribonuclease V subunit gamma [Chitinophagaceae bacterium]
MSLHLEVSNALEMLADELVRKIDAGKKNVFAPITIVTQTEGINLWLREYIAQKIGIAANIHFVSPNDIVFRIFQLSGGAYKETISRESLIWLLYKALGDRDFAEHFPGQVSYFQNPPHERDRKRMGMATKVADLFDQYQLYRQNVVAEWNDTPIRQHYQPQEWQEFLWKKIKSETPKDIQDKTLVKAFIHDNIQKTESRQRLQKALPRIYLFGLSIFTNYHLDILKQVADVVDVHFFLLNPAPQIYWMDDASDKQIAKWRSHKRNKDAFFLTGNPLLTNWGKVLQNTFRLLFRYDDVINNYNDSHVVVPKEDSLLHKLQANIFYNNSDENIAVTKEDLEDETVSIHSCYTIAAEVEALYQYLVHLVDNKNVSLSARDISVMVGDIDKYEPYIRAVFDNAPYRFKYRIADVSVADGDTIYNALRLLLQLDENDFTSEKVLQLLESSYIRKRFKLDNMEKVRMMVEAANIRFGMDGNIDDETYIVSWSYGLQRLMYGICMSGEPLVQQNGQFFYPLDRIEGNDSQNVVKFCHFVEMLMASIQRRHVSKTPTEWVVYVQWLVDNLVYQVVDVAEDDYASLKEHLGRYGDLSGMALEKVPFDVFRMHFLASLEDARRSSLYINEGITFCSLIPMRSVPFKVVALLGMTGKDFPRKEKPLSFSLLQQKYELGDRNLKDNDKHLFLETIVSAREYLYISYVGRSVKDNTELPPSVLVEELKDYIKVLAADTQCDVDKCIVTEHPLHLYSNRYNSGNPKLYRYTKKDNTAKDILGTQKKELPESFFTELTLSNLVAFFRNAPKAFYNKVFGVYFEEDSQLLPETEIFFLDNLENYQLKNAMLSLSESELEAWQNKRKLIGRLPLKNAGTVALEQACDAVALVKKAITERCPNLSPQKVPVLLHIDGTQLTGTVQNVYGSCLVAVCFSKYPRKYLVSAYIEALAGIGMEFVESLLFLPVPPNVETEMEVQDIDLRAVSKEEAVDTLRSLIAIYKEGMQSPYPFSDVVYGGDLQPDKVGSMSDNALNLLVEKQMDNSHVAVDAYHLKSYEEGVWSGQPAVDAFQKAFDAVFGPLQELVPEVFLKRKKRGD